MSDMSPSNIYEKISIFIFATFLAALSFNVFFSPNNFVIGGVSGLSIIFRESFNINESLFILVVSLALIILSYFTLGKQTTINSMLGTILFPLFIEWSKVYVNMISLEGTSSLLIIIFGSITYGFANGLILKSGYSLGGFQILAQVIHKYFKISMGKAISIINIIIILIGGYVFGIDKCLYAIIALYIISIVIDKVLIGISDKKTFYIITDEEKKVENYLQEKYKDSFTLMNVKGGVSGKTKKMLLCVIPTKQYTILKEYVLEIDKNAFFLITDTYEVFRGN